ncbi:MAG TPA: class I SAM-dependent methyltransferase [Gemmatirosa sp.]
MAVKSVALASRRLERQLVPDRENFVVEACRGKRVLHLGFVDYPYLRSRIAGGTWLHARLASVAREIVGVDMAGDDLAALRDHPEYGTLIEANAEELEQLGLEPFDVIVAGELVEHLDNPGRFLDSARSVLAPGGKLIVTVPNAYCVRRLLRIPFGVEKVHPDHVAYYSQATLRELLRRHGYELVYTAGYRLAPRGENRLAFEIDRVASVISPNLCEGVVCVAADARAAQRSAGGSTAGRA